MTVVAERHAASHELGTAILAQLLDLGHACWPDGDFTTHDRDHVMGGRHFLAQADGRVVAHAAVVPRVLEVGGRSLRAGHVEAVATLPSFQGQGIASRLGLAALDGTDLRPRTHGTPARTPDEDDGIMSLWTPATPPGLSGDVPIACPWRPGDAW